MLVKEKEFGGGGKWPRIFFMWEILIHTKEADVLMIEEGEKDDESNDESK